MFITTFSKPQQDDNGRLFRLILSLYTISDSAKLQSNPATVTSIPNKEKEMSIPATDSSKSGSSSNYCFYCPKGTVDASATLESKSKQHYDH